MTGTEGTGTNRAGNLYGLTVMCPIKNGAPTDQDRSYAQLVEQTLAGLKVNEASPFASVPDTYFARFYVLKDVFYERRPAREEHLKSQYLVFTADFHGELDRWAQGMHHAVETDVQSIWQHCVGFDKVRTADDFATYLKRCQITNALLFQGSTDEPLGVQLKSLYLKQEFGQFVTDHQRLPAADLKQAFLEFAARVEVDNLARPTWRAGASTLDSVEVPQ